MHKKIALIYIGQSPRADITPDIINNLPSSFSVAEYGALDGLDALAIAALAPQDESDSPLVTKLCDGTTATVCERSILPLIQCCIDNCAASGTDVCAIMCTGSFPKLKSTVQLITTDQVFHKDVVLADNISTIGLIVPKYEQMAEFAAQYTHLSKRIVTAFASPYGDDDDLVAAAKGLCHSGADIIMLDCMGYTPRQKELVQSTTGLEVRIPRIEICKAMQ